MLMSFFTFNTSTNMQFWLVITPPNLSCTYIYICASLGTEWSNANTVHSMRTFNWKRPSLVRTHPPTPTHKY